MTGMREMGTARLSVITALAVALASVPYGTAVAQDDGTAETSPSGPGVLAGVDLETVEVAPGVYQVLGDGVRDLTRPIEIVAFDPHMSPGDAHRVNAIVTRGLAANDNGVWLGGPDGIFRLGQDELAWEAKPSRNWWRPGLDVTPANRLYRASERGSGVEVLRDGEWKKVVPKLSGFRTTESTGRFTSDGSLWLKGNNLKNGKSRRTVFVRRDADGWTRIGSPPRLAGRPADKPSASIDSWGVTDDGELYVSRARRQVQRWADGSWETLPPPGGRIADLHVGPEGTVWVEREEADGWTYGGGSEFARLDGDGWRGYETGPPRYLYPSPEAVGADGAMWMAPGGSLISDGGCDGIIRIGDTGLDRFLLGHCVYDVAPGPNGELWLEAGTWDGNWYAPEAVGPVGVYVITPDAWMTTE